MRIIEGHGYIPHVVDLSKEADAKRRDPTRKARRWVVEVCRSWLNRFRKQLVRYEKLERSFVALNHIAAAVIAFRQVKLTVNIIYGEVLSSGCGGRTVRPAQEKVLRWHRSKDPRCRVGLLRLEMGCRSTGKV